MINKIFEFLSKRGKHKNEDKFMLLYTEIKKRIEIYRLLISDENQHVKRNLGMLMVLNEFEQMLKKADNIFKYGDAKGINNKEN